MTDYLSRLNPEQRAAVETVDGPVLVLAGAGTGKTRVLTTRFAHILLTGRAFPNQVLAVTFTNKAAREMRERVGALLGRPAEGLWLGTFHALCARMLRRHSDLVGLQSNFTILDTDDQLRLLKQVMESFKIDPKRWGAAGDDGGDPALERPRPDAGPRDGGGRHGLRRRAGAGGLPPPTRCGWRNSTRRISGICCCIWRKSCVPGRRCWRSITARSATSWWMSIRTRTGAILVAAAFGART